MLILHRVCPPRPAPNPCAHPMHPCAHASMQAGVLVELCGASYQKIPNPDREGGPPTEFEAWRNTRLPGLEAAIVEALGAPHNFEVGWNRKQAVCV